MFEAAKKAAGRLAWTEAMAGAADGDLSKVRNAVQRSPDSTNKQNKEGQTALHLAVLSGFEPIINELLDRYASCTLTDQAGRTPLHAAAAAGQARSIAALLGPRNKAAPADKQYLLAFRDASGCDALMVAVVAGHAEAVQQLMAAGADAWHSCDQTGAGPLHVAARLGHTHLMPILAHRCGLEQRDPNTGYTPLHAAAAAGQLPTVKWLLQAGASTTTKDNHGRTASEAALHKGEHPAHRTIRDFVRQGPAAGPGSPLPPQAGGVPPPGGAGGAPYPYPYGYAPAPGYAAYGQPGAAPYPAAVASPAGPAAAPEAPAASPGAPRPGGVLYSVPQEPPQAVAYPGLPEGAGVYY